MQTANARAALVGVLEPFPGLRPFESGEEPIFRGRRAHTQELLRRLAGSRFLAVVGTSGSGKSSLVRAGLRPALDRGYLAGATSRWRIALMRPGMAPIENLAEALRDPDALGVGDAATLRSSSVGLVEAVRDAGLAPGESLLVVADQFEELFRYQRRMAAIDGGSEAALFVGLLLTAASRPDAPVYIVLTMRSDFLGDCAQFPGLPEALSASQYLIPRLTREQRRQAIEEPLRLFGATMTPQLVEQLLNDSGEEVSDPAAGTRYRGGAPDPLPVLQHALMRTYLEWKSLPRSEGDGRIDLKHYRAAGRMESALEQHAEWVFTKELDEAGRKWAEFIFRCLTTTELGRPVRRPTLCGDLYKIVGAREEDRSKVDEVLAVLQRRENSFVKVHNDGTVDISHESLIWKWKRLNEWVEREATSAEMYRDLVKDALGKATWGEPKLSAALAVREQDAWNEHWAGQYSDSSFDDVIAFIARSRSAVRNQKWLRWFGVAAAVALIILGVVAYYSNRQALQKARELEATVLARDGLAKDLEKQKQDQTALAYRIASLNANQGATQEERDRIAKEKSDLEAQLAKSRDDSQKLAAQAQQSTDLLASVKSLQSRLGQAQRERDTAVKEQRDAESKAARLEARVNSLTKDLETARPATQAPGAPSETAAAPPPKKAASPEAAAATSQPVRTLQGNMNRVVSVAWSPDGKRLASASFDRPGNTHGVSSLRLWDPASGHQSRILDGNQDFVNCVAWSPDGKSLASASADTTVRLWDAAGGGLLRTLQGHSDSVESVGWSPDGKTLASASLDGTVRLWDARSGKLLRTLQGHSRYAFSVAWSPDGKTLASPTQGETVFWDAASGRLLRALSGHEDSATDVVWSPDGKTLASADAVTVGLWNARDGKFLRALEGHSGKVYRVAWSPDGKTLASGSEDKTVRLWDEATGRLLRTLEGHQDAVESVAWSPDGKTLASSGSGDGTIRLWALGDVAAK
jgi:WD40 repeat protein